MDTDQRFRKYYQTGQYKGFYMIHEHFCAFSCTTFVTFSNGKKNIYTSGIFSEEATVNAFKAIDQYHAQKRNTESLLVKA
ncbi:hypothetical protein [Fodinibius sp. AD559]|uniref:hypothetical protein n=1 Tax=Fodinibius sp. AD559 TaxID=3424179 RepID=UPI004046AF7F